MIYCVLIAKHGIRHLKHLKTVRPYQWLKKHKNLLSDTTGIVKMKGLDKRGPTNDIDGDTELLKLKLLLLLL